MLDSMKVCDIPAVVRILRQAYATQEAPVADFQRVRTRAPYRVLVATILSARTKDQTTSEASLRLFKRAASLADLRRIPARELERLIYPVGFYRTKARHLGQLPEAVDRLCGGRIPDTVEGLVRLPGVGRKTANLVVAEAFDRPAICVDVHVHRICNRLGLLRTRTPLETEMTLRRRLPVRYWKTFNPYLVSYGQTVCTPLNPRCDQCRLLPYCTRRGVKTRHPPREQP